MHGIPGVSWEQFRRVNVSNREEEATHQHAGHIYHHREPWEIWVQKQPLKVFLAL